MYYIPTITVQLPLTIYNFSFIVKQKYCRTVGSHMMMFCMSHFLLAF